MRKRAFLALFLLPCASMAQDKLPLADAVDRALVRFPAVGAARARQEEAAEALGEARAGRRPRGRLTGSAIQFQEPMVVTPIHGFGPGLFPEFDETLGQATLTVSYTLFDSGADAAAAAEEAEARIASLGKAVERFAEVVRVQKLLLDEGAGTQTDYLNSEADLLTARASLAEARHAAILARVDLARAAGRLTPAWLRENIQ